jgi:hypothetical protein
MFDSQPSKEKDLANALFPPEEGKKTTSDFVACSDEELDLIEEDDFEGSFICVCSRSHP